MHVVGYYRAVRLGHMSIQSHLSLSPLQLNGCLPMTKRVWWMMNVKLAALRESKPEWAEVRAAEEANACLDDGVAYFWPRANLEGCGAGALDLRSEM